MQLGLMLRGEGVEGNSNRGGDCLKGQGSQVDWSDGPRVIFLKFFKSTALSSSAAAGRGSEGRRGGREDPSRDGASSRLTCTRERGRAGWRTTVLCSLLIGIGQLN